MLLRLISIRPTVAPTSTVAIASTRLMLPPCWLAPVRSSAVRAISPVTSCCAMIGFATRYSRILSASDAESAQGVRARRVLSAIRAKRVCHSLTGSCPAAGNRAIEPHHVSNHFRDRLVVLGRDLLVDLPGGMECTGERRVFHKRRTVKPRSAPTNILLRQHGGDRPKVRRSI